MKQLSKTEIENNVAETFNEFPQTNKLYATLDGNVFIEENRAKLHATIKGQVLVFNRPNEAAEDKETIKLLSAKEAIALIEVADSLEDIEPYRADDRKSVKAAFDKKLQEIYDSTFGNNAKEEEIEVTQEFLDTRPDLVDWGVQVGDKFKIPKV